MSESKLKADIPVQSVGRSWIVCKSKSRSGHVYYFNTLTGETVWNLSDAEQIGKAEDIKKNIDAHHLVKSPEPKEQPQIAFAGQSKESANQTTQINIQVSSQQIPNTSFPHFANSSSTCSNEINNFTALNTLSAFSQGQNSLNFNNTTSMYNPHVWAVPQQIFISPTVSPLVNQAQTSLNGYRNIHQTISGENISAPSASNYEVGNQILHSPKKNMVHNFKNNFRSFGQNRPNASNYKFKNRNDLRTRISVNKRFQSNKRSPFTSRARNFGQRQQKNNQNFNMRTFVPDGTSKQFVYEDTSSKLDLTPLKNYAAANVEDNWYIVVDMDVILNEFKFLNTLSDSDSQCHLVVPQHVMSELKHHVATSQDVQARRIQRFLSHQIEQGDVMIAEEPCDDDDDTPNILLSTCLQLSEENFYVVLLTNDSELNNYKDSIPIPILTPIDVKRLLNVNLNKNQCISKPSTFRPNRPFKNVLISSESDNSVSHNITFTKSPNSPSPPKGEKECGAKAMKKTLDAAIQTDFSDFKPNNTMESRHIINMENQKCDGVKLVENKSDTDIVTCVNSDKGIKKRTIQLKRSTSNELLIAPLKTNQKRNFKWRRRKNPLSEDLNVKKSNKVIEDRLKKSHTQDVIKSSSIASSDVSIVCKNVNDNNIIIEESSMSGISNTAGNVDVEINNTKQLEAQFYFDNENKEIITVLYGVNSPSMEKYLESKRDEWVSRFIQIMELALTVVLQHDPPFSNDSLPPPWNIYEAVQCIKIKFNNNKSINDAAFTLSNILLNVSDRRGKINKNIQPAEYMEMYSFGVYLLDTITAAVDNCEDLQIGVESLKKLLHDIQNPNMDNSAQVILDISLGHGSAQISSGNTSQSCLEIPEKVFSPEKLINKKDDKYNLRPSKKRRLFQDDEIATKPVKGARRTLDPESAYFTSLKLRKNIDLGNLKGIKQTIFNDKQIINNLRHDGNKEDNNLEKVEDTSGKKCDTLCNSGSENDMSRYNGEKDLQEKDYQTEPPEPLKDLCNTNQSDSQDKVQDNIVSEPRVLFRFRKCSEMEEKLKNVSEQDYEYASEEYASEEEFDENAGHDEEDIEVDDFVDDGELSTAKSPEVPETFSSENNIKTFKYVVGMIMQEIQQAFYAVTNLCENYFEESKSPEGPKMKKIELRVKLKNASALIHDICKSLDSMLEREAKDSNNNMEALFRKAGCQDFYLDDELKAEYSDIIAKCKNYAEDFLNGIQNILSTLNC